MSPGVLRTTSFTFLLAAVLAAPAAAQLEANLGALSGENTKRYLDPLTSGLSATLNSAIFQTARVPQAGFDLVVGVKVMGMSFKDEDRSFAPLAPEGFAGPATVPTVIGDPASQSFTGPGGAEINFPGGFDIGEFALAVPQISVGSVLGTRAVLRYISVELGDNELGEVSVFGIGAQHSISQYLPGLPMDVAGGLFFQTLSIGDGLVDANSFHVGVMASRRYGVLQPYAGLGLDSFGMKAEYTSDVSGTEEKIEVDFDRKTNARLTLGAMLGFPVVKLHGELSYAAGFGAALGLSFGK